MHQCRVIERKQIVQITTCHWLWHLPILLTNMQQWDVSSVCIIFGIWVWETALASFWWNCHCSYFTFKSILTSLKNFKIFQAFKAFKELKKIEQRGKIWKPPWEVVLKPGNLDLSTGCPSWPPYNFLWFYLICNIFSAVYLYTLPTICAQLCSLLVVGNIPASTFKCD